MKKIILLAAVLMAAFTAASAQDIPSDAKVKGLIDGKEAVMGDLLGEDVVIVSFWASWCPPCRAEMAAMSDAAASWKDKVRVLTVSIDDSRTLAKARSMAVQNKWPFELYHDPEQKLAAEVGVTSIPHVIIVKDGKPVYSHKGFVSGGEKTLIQKAISFLD